LDQPSNPALPAMEEWLCLCDEALPAGSFVL